MNGMMYEKLIVTIVYLLLGWFIIVFSPEHIDLYLLLGSPIISFWFARNMRGEVYKRIEELRKAQEGKESMRGALSNPDYFTTTEKRRGGE